MHHVVIHSRLQSLYGERFITPACREGTDPSQFWPVNLETVSFEVNDTAPTEQLQEYTDRSVKAYLYSKGQYAVVTVTVSVLTFFVAASSLIQRILFKNYVEFYRYKNAYESTTHHM